MASQIAREKVFGNFKPSIRDRRKPKPSAAEKREGNSERHLELIRRLPCCITGRTAPSDPHHLKFGLSHERGMGRKATDKWVLPLCREKHDELERLGSRREPGWFRDHGIDDPLALADALWRATGDIHRMARIIEASRARHLTGKS